MAHSIDDITELVRYHLVVSAENDSAADRNLDALIRNVESMFTSRTPHHFIEWMTCDGCGASVSTELIDPDGAAWTTDGGFECSSCRFGDESDLQP